MYPVIYPKTKSPTAAVGSGAQITFLGKLQPGCRAAQYQRAPQGQVAGLPTHDANLPPDGPPVNPVIQEIGGTTMVYFKRHCDARN
jgi:hypothetical protein